MPLTYYPLTLPSPGRIALWDTEALANTELDGSAILDLLFSNDAATLALLSEVPSPRTPRNELPPFSQTATPRLDSLVLKDC